MSIKLYWRKNYDQCKIAMNYFEEKQTKIEKIDVTFDKEKFAEMLRLGGIATPLIVIGDHIFHSFDREKIDKAMEELE
jgi:glutaredoxin